jgi:hypothetical protein
LGPRLGQIPLAAGQVKPETGRYSANWGQVTRNGLLLHFPYVTFHRVFDGPPALAEWLCAKGCLDVQYGFHPGMGSSDLDDD